MDLGEIASAKAIEVLCEGFAAAQEGTSLQNLLPRLIQQANQAIHDESLRPERAGQRMGTTVVTCALRHDHAYVANVGDSRCYLIRDGKASIVTRDHTWVNEQRKLGVISEADAQTSQSRHILTRSLGAELFVLPDSTSFSVRAGDILVLCSDGLYNGLHLNEIAHIASRKRDLNLIAQQLVEESVAADGSDNTSVQVISIRAIEPMAMYRGRLYTRPGA
jgi:protein phosphatase